MCLCTPGSLVDHSRGCDDEIQVILPLQALLDNLHVQQAQEAAAEAKAHGAGHLQCHAAAGLPSVSGPVQSLSTDMFSAWLGLHTDMQPKDQPRRGGSLCSCLRPPEGL